MQTKQIGILLIGIAVIMLIVVLLFKSSLETYLYTSCPLLHNTGANECPATKTLNQQSYLAYTLVAIIALVGVILTVMKPEQKIIIKRIKTQEKKQEINTADLTKEEKQIVKILQEEKTLFQGDLIEKTQFGKAKITRILDKLENRQIIERKRRGLTNIVVLKE